MSRIFLAALTTWLAACAPKTSPAALSTPYDGPGRECIGREIASRLPTALDPAARAMLVRWWTDACPYCELSLPALDELRARHAGAGLSALAVYHPKPPRAVDEAFARAAATRLGWHGAIALDPDWSALRAVWLDEAPRPATSVTFLLDRHGRVRWLHPGPELHASEDLAAHGECATSFRALERALEDLLRED